MIVKVPGHPGPPPVRPPAFPDYSGWKSCPHEHEEIRRDNHPKIGVRYRRQCVTCGAGRGLVAKSVVKYFLGIKPFDYELEKEWNRRRDEYFARVRQENEEARAKHEREWARWYAAYLESPQWSRLRQQVLERDGFKCHGCHGRAAQAHHLTYERVGYELLMDLVAVCLECHKRLHDR